MADIVCLCEVDHLDDLYGAFMKELGYEFQVASRRGKDNVLVAYDPNKFSYVEHSEVQHDDLSEFFPPVKVGMAQDFARGNCALYVTLKHLPSGKTLQMVGTHLHWNPSRDFVKYAQVMNTCKHANSDMPLLLCGDLNSSPESNTLGYLTDVNHVPVPYKQVRQNKVGYYAKVEQKLSGGLKGAFASAYA